MRSLHLPFKFSSLLISFILLFSSQNIFAQSGWTLLNKASDYQCIEKISSTKLIAYGSDYYKTSTDNGENWSLPKATGYTLFGKVCWVDSLYGFGIVLNGNLIEKTTDGGVSWNAINMNSYPIGVRCVNFLNRTTGWAAGVNTTGQGQVVKTTNGGLNWSVQNLNFDEVNSICIINGNKLFLTTSNANQTDSVARTTDGGQSWFKIKIATSHFSNKIVFTDSLNGWSCGFYDPYRTVDGGNTWTNSGVALGNCREILFLNSNTGWFVTQLGQVFKTTNQGINWFSQNNSTYAFDLFFEDVNTGWIAGAEGKILSTTNGGANWKMVLNPFTQASSLQFINDDTGYLISRTGAASVLLKTSNQGVRWNLVDTFRTQHVVSLKVLDNQTFFLGSYSGKAFNTHNGGVSWDSVALTNSPINDFFFVNNNTGWLCGDSGKIFKTTNSGTSWQNQSLPSYNKLNRIYFTDALFGHIAADSGNYFTTSNGGTNWMQYSIHPKCSFSSIKFADASTGYMCGYYRDVGMFSYIYRPQLYKTTNGGTNWSLILYTSSSATTIYNELSFSDASTGLLGWTGGLRRTVNGGTSWENQTLPIPCNITAISELNSGKVYAVSPEGILYANFNPTNIRHINEGVIAESYSLHQNYPNPFNPTTKINFDLKNSAFALLRVYDITGSEVRTLVNEKLSAGSYSYDFNASELPSGVYFYQLQADGFVETKKMILLK